MTGFQLDRHEAIDLTESFWQGLEKALDSGILEHVLAQMPEGLRRIFGDQNPMVDTIQMEFSYALSQ